MPEEKEQTQTATAEQTKPAAETAKTAEEPKTAPEAAEQKPETQPAAKEPELTIDSYGDLGIQSEDGITINEEAREEFKKLALELKLPVDSAKKLASYQYEQIKRQNQALKDLQDKWDKENASTYGDNLKNVQTNAARVLKEMDKDGKFTELLQLAGADKAPATLAFLKAIGDQVLEKGSINPNAAPNVDEKELKDFY